MSGRALVTGGTGFIGGNLVRELLARGVEVRAVVRPTSPNRARLQDLDVEIVEGDLADAECVRRAVSGVATIYHAAGVTSRTPGDIPRSNVLATDLLLEEAVVAGAKRFLFLSDIEIYDLPQVGAHGCVREDSPRRTDRAEMGEYVYSKLQSERSVLRAHRERGLGVSIVRPGMVIGPSGQTFFPHLGSRLGARWFVMVGTGALVLPLICVENLVAGMLRAATEPAAVGRDYILVDDAEVTVRDYLTRLLQASESAARILRCPYPLAYAATGVQEALGRTRLARLNTTRARFRWKHVPVRFDSSRARAELGWTSEMELAACLDRAFRWHAEQRSTREPTPATP